MNLRTLLTAAACCGLACATTPPARPDSKPAEAAPPPAISAKPAADSSLDAYLEAGVPAPDRTWTTFDYARANEALQTLKDGRTRLPRYGDPVTGVLFAKLVDEAILEPMKNPEHGLKARLDDGMRVLTSSGALVQLYVEAHTRSPDYAAELARLSVIGFLGSSAMFDLASEIPNAPEGTENRAKQDAGRAQMGEGLATAVGGLMTMASAPDEIAEPERLHIARSLRRELPRQWHYVPPLSAKELRAKLDKLVKSEPAPAVKSELQQLAAELAR